MSMRSIYFCRHQFQSLASIVWISFIFKIGIIFSYPVVSRRLGCSTISKMAVGRRKVVSRTKAETTKPLPSSAISTEGHDMYTNNDDGSLFWKWANHQDTSFHRFTLLEATAIRDALLHWYRANRRKLPWRGDPPPYDGSTAGIATSTAAKAAARNKKKSKKHDDNTTPVSSEATRQYRRRQFFFLNALLLKL